MQKYETRRQLFSTKHKVYKVPNLIIEQQNRFCCFITGALPSALGSKYHQELCGSKFSNIRSFFHCHLIVPKMTVL